MTYLKICFILCLLCISCCNAAEIETGEFKLIYNPSVGEAENWYINDHCFVYDSDSRWHLFGITHQEPMNPFDEDNFAHAVSFDLHTGWQKQAFALTTDESVGEVHLWAPHIIFHDGLYYMFYCAGGKSGAEYHIKLAVSEDLYHWKKHAENPMVIDGYDARDPFIYRDNEKWRMYYTATTSPKGGNHIVAAVESDDLIHWTNRKIVFTDDSTGTWGGPTESPTVIKRGDSYYLFIGPRDDYRGTCVYKSNNLLEFKKENLVGKIASHAAEVVRDLDENWYVSHSGWGQGGVYLAPLKWNAGNDDKAASLEAPQRPTGLKKTKTQFNKIAVQDYRDKMSAGWLGQMVAVAWGAPVEFKYQACIMPEANIPQWSPEMINNGFGQDDLYVEMIFLRSIQKYGFDVSPYQAGIDFANTRFQLWHANEQARINLRKGIAPPDSGHPQFNPHADDIDFQIEADFAGLISPGLPNFAVEMGNKFGTIMNYGDGLYGGLFVAAMYSYAFFEKNPEIIIEKAMTHIPSQSQYAQTVYDVLKLYRENPEDWKTCWNFINEKYHLNSHYRKFSCTNDNFNIDAKINGAYIAMGLLYGKGDIEKTIKISMMCGQDSDCNPSNAAGILFTTMGCAALPEQYKKVNPNLTFSNTSYDMNHLYDVCEILARRAVYRCGGYTEQSSVGGEIFVIPSDTAQAVSLEKSFAPEPIKNSNFSTNQQNTIKSE